MRKHVTDPLLGISVVLAALGALQASTNLFTHLVTKYPTAAGAAVTAISVLTAVLTVIKNAQATRIQAEYEAVREAAAIFHTAKAARQEGDGTGHE